METKDIYAETVRHFLAPILPLLDDPSVTEILINGHRTIYFERDGKLNRAEMDSRALPCCSPPPAISLSTLAARSTTTTTAWTPGCPMAPRPRHRAAQLAERRVHLDPQVQEVDVQSRFTREIRQHVGRGQGVFGPVRVAA